MVIWIINLVNCNFPTQNNTLGQSNGEAHKFNTLRFARPLMTYFNLDLIKVFESFLFHIFPPLGLYIVGEKVDIKQGPESFTKQMFEREVFPTYFHLY
jgi:hypothetical protein